MDQPVLAGVGNIQAIEALWKAGIDPRSKASAISMVDLQAIGSGLRWTTGRTLADLARGGAGALRADPDHGDLAEDSRRRSRDRLTSAATRARASGAAQA